MLENRVEHTLFLLIKSLLTSHTITSYIFHTFTSIKSFSRRRSRREFLSTTTNGLRVPLLDDDKAAMEGNLRQLEDRVSRLRGDMDTKG